MGHQIFTLQNRSAWQARYDQLPSIAKDIYATPGFYALFESENNGQANCFFFERNGEFAMYPYLKSNVNNLGYILPENYYDIQAPYGYNGLLATTHDVTFISEFSDEFQSFCKQENIIAEMIRFNPVTKNERLMPYAEAIDVLENVTVDLSRGYDFVWNNSFEKTVRNRVRKAEAFKLSFEYYTGDHITDEKVEWFKTIYLGTMQRNKASRAYYFDELFFSRLLENLSADVLLVFVLVDSRPVSTELLFLNESTAYGYLGVTAEDMFHANPNTFLCHKLMEVLTNHFGIKCYSMGGGLSRHDGLFKFKKSFSKNSQGSSIYIGRKIHNEKVYNNVVEQWQARFPLIGDQYKNYVL